MRTNEQFKQEIIKRAEVYKKVKKDKRKKYICFFAAVVICITALSAAVSAISNNIKTKSAYENGSSYSTSALAEVGDTAKADSIYEGGSKYSTKTGVEEKTENVKVGYSAEILTSDTAFYTADKDLVLEIYTAVNNSFEAFDTEESAYESVTNGEIYELSIAYEGVFYKYYFNGSAVKKDETDWISISESAAKEIKAAIDKII